MPLIQYTREYQHIMAYPKSSVDKVTMEIPTVVENINDKVII